MSLGTAVVVVAARNEKASAKIVSSRKTGAADAEARGRELDRLGGVAEGDRQVPLGLLHPAQLVDEVHVPGGPPELPVGRRAQPEALLEGDGGRDGLVLDGGQGLGREPPRLVGRPGLEELARAQQAADVVGPERRLGSRGHGRSLPRAGPSALRATLPARRGPRTGPLGPGEKASWPDATRRPGGPFGLCHLPGSPSLWRTAGIGGGQSPLPQQLETRPHARQPPVPARPRHGSGPRNCQHAGLRARAAGSS